MSPKELFDTHQEILAKLLSGDLVDASLEKKIKEFLLVVNAKIAAYVHTIDALSYEHKKFTGLAHELCSMRDLIEENKGGPK